jgi:hypothetical protein
MSVLKLASSNSAYFVIDGASTRAQLIIGPDIYGVIWYVERIVVTTNSSQTNGQSRCRVYLNTESVTALLDGTYSGDQDVNETKLTLMAGEKLFVVWTGGDFGALATIIVSGTYETGR